MRRARCDDVACVSIPFGDGILGFEIAERNLLGVYSPRPAPPVATPAPEGVSPVHAAILEYTSRPSTWIKEAYAHGTIADGVAAALAAAWAMVREKAGVITYSPGIPEEHKARLGHTHAPSIEWALDEAFRRHGRDAGVAVLTHAPEMLPIGKR
jgi:hypothetical protein